MVVPKTITWYNRPVIIRTERKQYPTFHYISYPDTQLALLSPPPPPPTTILNPLCMLLWSQDKMTAALSLESAKWEAVSNKGNLSSFIATSIMFQNINVTPPSPKCKLCCLDVSFWYTHSFYILSTFCFEGLRYLCPAVNLGGMGEGIWKRD